MPKTAFLFSGQGAQYPGMMEDLFSSDPKAESVLKRADELLGKPISSIVRNGEAEELNRTEITQPAMLACEIAALNALQSAGIRADYLAGFSLGEWAALVAGGVISYDTALEIVNKRAGYMQTAVPIGEGGMAVILGKTRDEVEELCSLAEGVSPSNFNCPGQTAVAGRIGGIKALMELCAERSVVAKLLPISVPSHCPLMQPAADKLEELLATAEFQASSLPIVMNYDAKPHTDASSIRENMALQLTHAVRFEDTIRFLLGEGVDTFVEIGPGKTLAGLVKKTAKAANASCEIMTTDGRFYETLQKLSGGSRDE